MTFIQQFWGAIAPYTITGVLVSSLVQVAKNYIDSKANKIALTIAASFLGGAIIYAAGFIPVNFLTGIVGVWAAANTVYLTIFKPFQSSTPVS